MNHSRRDHLFAAIASPSCRAAATQPKFAGHSNRLLPVAAVLLLATAGTCQSAAEPALHGAFAAPVPPPQTNEPRWILMLNHRTEGVLPFDERCRGWAVADQATLHAQDVAQREFEYYRDLQAVLGPLQAAGGSILTHLPELRCCVMAGNPEAIAAIRNLPGVACVVADAVCKPQLLAPAVSDQNAIRAEHHGTALAHQAGFTGLGGSAAPTLAIVDSWLAGWFNSTLRHHRTLHQGGVASGSDRVLIDFDVTGTPGGPPWYVSTSPSLSHGLGMAAFAAGHGGDQPTFRPLSDGQAPNARLVSVNVTRSYLATNYTCGGHSYSDPAGQYAYTADMLAGLNWLSANRFAVGATLPIQVANLSFGGPTNPDHPLNLAIDQLAVNSGILVVTSAGNYDTPTSPFEAFNSTNGIAVGACKMLRAAGIEHPVADYSGQGPLNVTSTAGYCSAGASAGTDPAWPMPSNAYARQYPDIAALGALMVAPIQGDESKALIEEGTSISTAVVSGAATLHLAGPDGNNSIIHSILETKAALLATAENQNVDGVGDNLRGAGMLRTDRLMGVPAVAASVTTMSASVANVVGSTSVTTLNSDAGARYGIAIAWFRTNFNPGLVGGQPRWADLDLEVTDTAGNQLLAQSLASVGATFGNRAWERLEFTSSVADTFNVAVVVRRIAPGTSAPIVVGVAVAQLTTSAAPSAAVSMQLSSTTNSCTVPQAPFQPSTNTTLPAGVVFAPTVADLRELALAFHSELNLGASSGLARVTMHGRFQHDMVIPCHLLGGSFYQEPQAPNQPIPPPVIVPNNSQRLGDSLLVVDAAAGTATAEFAVGTGARFLVFQTTPEMSLLMPRTVAGSVCGIVPYARSLGSTTWGAYHARTVPQNYTYWGCGSVYYDLTVESPQSPMFSNGIPKLTVKSLPILGHSYTLTVQGADQQNVASFKAAIIASDFSASEVPLPDPGCFSIMKSSSFTSQFLFFASSGTNPGSSTALDTVVPMDPALFGVTYFQQGLLLEQVGSTWLVRPTAQIAAITPGL